MGASLETIRTAQLEGESSPGSKARLLGSSSFILDDTIELRIRQSGMHRSDISFRIKPNCICHLHTEQTVSVYQRLKMESLPYNTVDRDEWMYILHQTEVIAHILIEVVAESDGSRVQARTRRAY